MSVIIDFDAGPTQRVVAVSVIADLTRNPEGQDCATPSFPRRRESTGRGNVYVARSDMTTCHCRLDPQSRGAATAGTPSIPIHVIPHQLRHSRAGRGANVLFFESGFLGLWRIYRTEAMRCIVLWIHAFCKSTNKHPACTVNSNGCVYVRVLRIYHHNQI